MSYTDFLLRLTDDGGPAPDAEIASLLEQCRSGAKGRGYFGVRKSGSGWARQPPGGPAQYAVILFIEADGTLSGCVADIVDKWPKGQAPKSLPDLYASWVAKMESWWTLRDATPISPGMHHLRDIPGHSILRKTADTAFRGGTNQVTFVGWTFDGDPRTALCAAEPAVQS